MLFNTQVKDGVRVAISIPASGGAGATLMSLLRAAGCDGSPTALYIDPIAPGTGGTSRLGFMAASPRQGTTVAVAGDFSTHGQYVPAGAPYYLPIERDVELTSVMSLNGSSVPALCIVMF